MNIDDPEKLFNDLVKKYREEYSEDLFDPYEEDIELVPFKAHIVKHANEKTINSRFPKPHTEHFKTWLQEWCVDNNYDIKKFKPYIVL